MMTRINCWSLIQSLANRSWIPSFDLSTRFVLTYLVQPLFFPMPLYSMNSLSIIQSLMMHICRNTTCCLSKPTFHFLIEWMNNWMNEQILERWQNWMLYSWRKAHLFILDSIKQSESGNKKCKNRSFLVILTPRCVAICAVTWSFPFIWPTCDSRTYHWFNSKGPKNFSRSCICPIVGPYCYGLM